jgi:thioredoxin-like negative regulator of GroEL
VFEQFVTEYPEVDFYKVDVDETDDVAAECGIQAMPTFQFFKGGEKIEEVRGADVARLKAIIEANK